MAEAVAYMKLDGTCRTAFELYRKCLGGELAIAVVGDALGYGQVPANERNKVLHADLSDNGWQLLGSYIIGQGRYERGNDVSLCLVCDSRRELEELFANLSQGDQVTRPVKEEFFGDLRRAQRQVRLQLNVPILKETER